jgi:hypothetical protein
MNYNQHPRGSDSITGRNECANLWRTEPFSIPLAIAGGALLTLGIVILVNSRQKTKKGRRGGDSEALAAEPAAVRGRAGQRVDQRSLLAAVPRDRAQAWAPCVAAGRRL